MIIVQLTMTFRSDMRLKTIILKTVLILLSIGVDFAVVAFCFKADWRNDTLFCVILLVLLIAGVRQIDFDIYLLFRSVSSKEEDSQKS